MDLTISLSDEVSQQITALAKGDVDRVPLVAVTLIEQALTQATRRAHARALVAQARYDAAALADVPHADLFAQFRQLGEEIRQQAIANGTTIEDWPLDD